jgi:hypothetical protein
VTERMLFLLTRQLRTPEEVPDDKR